MDRAGQELERRWRRTQDQADGLALVTHYQRRGQPLTRELLRFKATAEGDDVLIDALDKNLITRVGSQVIEWDLFRVGEIDACKSRRGDPLIKIGLHSPIAEQCHGADPAVPRVEHTAPIADDWGYGRWLPWWIAFVAACRGVLPRSFEPDGFDVFMRSAPETVRDDLTGRRVLMHTVRRTTRHGHEYTATRFLAPAFRERGKTSTTLKEMT
jgi:hypothetical protein